jgi:hypothetical protein
MDIERHFRIDDLKRYALQCGLVLNEWTIVTLVVVLAGVIVLSVIKQLVLPVLLDLI